MADEKSVYLNFGGDTSKLEAALALANAGIRATSREIVRLSNEIHRTGGTVDSEVGQKFAEATEKLSRFKAGAASARAEMAQIAGAGGEAAKGVEAVGHAGGMSSVQVAESIHVVKSLFDEIAAGQNPMRALAMEGGRVFQILSMGIPTVIAGYAAVGAAALAAAGYVAYLSYEAYEAGKAAKGVQFDAALNQIVSTRQAADELVAAVRKIGDVGATQAREFIEPFLKLGPAGEAISTVASQYLPAFVANGKNAKEAGEELAKAFVDVSRGGSEVIANSRLLTEEEKRQALAYVASGDTVKAYGYVMEIATRSMAGIAAEQRNAKESAEQFASQVQSLHDSLPPVITGVDSYAKVQAVLAANTAEATKKTQEQEAELGRWINKAAMATDQAGRLAAAMSDAMKIDRTSSAINDLEGKVKEFQGALGSTKDPESIAQLNRSLLIAQDNLKNLRDQAVGGLLGGTSLDRVEKQNRVIEQENQGPKSEQLKKELPGLQAVAGDPTIDAKQRADAEEKAAALILKIRDAEFAETKAKDGLRVTEAGKNSAQIISLRQKEVADAIRVYGQGSQEAIQAEQQLASAKQAAATSGAKDSEKAAKDALGANAASIEGQIRALQDQTRAELEHLDAQVKLKQITEDKKATLAVAALMQEQRAVDALYAKEVALAGLTLTKKQEIANKQLAFDDQVGLKLQETQIKAAEASQKAWETATKTINSAFDGQISGLLRGTTSWGAAFKNVFATLTEDAIKFFVNLGLQDAENLAKHMATNAGLLASDAATQATATAQHAAGAAAKKAVDATTVQGDAARAAAGAYAAVAGVPLIGPVLAPAAAAAAYAGALAFNSFDIGAWSIPSDQLAMVHRNELVMPAAEAAAFRSMLSGAASGGGASGGGSDTHFHYAPSVQAIDARGVSAILQEHGRLFAKEVARQWNTQTPSTRPAY